MRGAGVPSAPVSCTSRYQLALGGPRGVCPINRSAAPRRGSTAAGPRTQTQASGRGHPSCGSGTLPCPLRKAATAAAPSTEPAALQLARTTGTAPSSAGNVPTPPQMHKSPSSGAPCPQKCSGWRQPRTGPPPVGLRRLRAGLGAAAWENPAAARRLRLNGGAGYGAGGQLRPEPPLPTFLPPSFVLGGGRDAVPGQAGRTVAPKGGIADFPAPQHGLSARSVGSGKPRPRPRRESSQCPTTVTRPPLAPHESSTHLLEPPLCCVRGNGAGRDPARDPAPLHPPIPQHTSPMGPGPARGQVGTELVAGGHTQPPALRKVQQRFPWDFLRDRRSDFPVLEAQDTWLCHQPPSHVPTGTQPAAVTAFVTPQFPRAAGEANAAGVRCPR